MIKLLLTCLVSVFYIYTSFATLDSSWEHKIKLEENLVQAKLKYGNYDEIIIKSTQLGELFGTQEAFLEKGIALFNLGRYQEAISAFIDQRIACSLNNQYNTSECKDYIYNASLYYNGACKEQLDKLKDALKYYDQALFRNYILRKEVSHVFENNMVDMRRNNVLKLLGGRPEYQPLIKDRELYYKRRDQLEENLAQAKLKYDNYEEIIAICDELNVPAKIEIALFEKGIALFNLGRYQEAISVFDDQRIALNENIVFGCMELDGDMYATSLYYKAVCLEKLGKLHDALRYYDLAVLYLFEDDIVNMRRDYIIKLLNSLYLT